MMIPQVEVIQETVTTEVSWEKYFKLLTEVRVFDDNNPEVCIYGCADKQHMASLDITLFSDEEIDALYGKFDREKFTKIFLKYTDRYDSDSNTFFDIDVYEYEID